MGTDMAADGGGGAGSLESRPGVFLIGSPNVGKRTILSRLLSIDLPDTYDLSSGILCQGWNIETKYYSVDLAMWIAHLEKGFSLGTLPFSKQLAALVMIFDMNDESSFIALQDWVATIDISRFEILLCIGNKADLVLGHHAHAEYRRRLQKHGESTSDPHPEYLDYGIYEAEASSLLEDDQPPVEIRKSYLEWCSQYNIEYLEACASNAAFDKCLSADGDIQGLERLYGALSAYMWPGMILKSGKVTTIPFLFEKEETTDDESDYEIEYEVLSGGSDEAWDYIDASDVSFKESSVTRKNRFAEAQIRDDQGPKHDEIIDCDKAEAGISTCDPNDDTLASSMEKTLAMQNMTAGEQHQNQNVDISDQVSTSEVEVREELGVDEPNSIEPDIDEHAGYEDMEKLMCEIGSMRDNLRLMPDFQRRDMAAKLAMKMAAMFGHSSDDDKFE